MGDLILPFSSTALPCPKFEHAGKEGYETAPLLRPSKQHKTRLSDTNCMLHEAED